jgi:hypothetical protein
MSIGMPLGEVWGFAQTTNAGRGYWYRIGLGRTDEDGRALAKLITSPFKTFTGDIIICTHGTKPPGDPPAESFPLLRRAGAVEENSGATLGVMWGHAATYRSGKGYYERTGVGWFDRQGRAHGKIHLTINSGFKGFIAICPPGVKPPQDPMPPTFVQPPSTEHAPRAFEENDEPDEESELL